MWWKVVDEARYWDMLGCLPPALMTGHGFLVGEAWDHGPCTVSGRLVPRFTAFVQLGDAFFEALEPMSVVEFRALKPADVRS